MGELYIGPVPYGEECEQVGMPSYNAKRARDECNAFANQLRRIWPDGKFVVKSQSHDFGSYYEVSAVWNENDEHQMNIAFEAESTGPEHWDTEAQIELGIRPRDDGYMANEHFEAILDKNAIARHCASVMRGNVEVDIPFIMAKLETIEAWIGVANQPSIKDIFDHNSKEAGFRI